MTGAGPVVMTVVFGKSTQRASTRGCEPSSGFGRLASTCQPVVGCVLSVAVPLRTRAKLLLLFHAPATPHRPLRKHCRTSEVPVLRPVILTGALLFIVFHVALVTFVPIKKHVAWPLTGLLSQTFWLT